MSGSKELGDFGERVACFYLKNKGYKILERNYFENWSHGTRKGEIDIIAGKEGNFYFIEVKTSAQAKLSAFHPEDKIDFHKQRQIASMAQDWLLKNKIPIDSKWQIDAISIKIDLETKKAKIRHLENIVSDN
ncbi:MAG: hypothetical protein A3F95_02410 [Candidatus Nealsonbacteria bacterium RIFCSPLOWO2_12_FULL_39_31]|uniref:UPF0102 protein A2W71_02365 n=3 Tax=Candidatus Nealsoniibacteriota TaxID=1817911 RepID=A0A1G2EIS7_9BACT|nr:MAG: hypothetical protein US88_C0006G0016 [Parcubacteria group bacterium GW2011_GWA2_38_27]KKQ97934.1 MAG: hypothetical protein UT22_C0006G0015 [Parcubacteria group bacterium GW2011_GWC2_39_11]OGZ20361.1 MAG: hypothetical protein A2626_00920 [Candidatus Nealsonbacteria bacterium RIFCSPHIGHO2_01_FULL_38_55]OGZ21250.1 MAG: hypothetical protein A3C48_02165 [Candidatus Nealsonbacteria bacterium RIFCSPHIGHO2_02_FULL_38_75]OGZ21752.1 MAG: hypothetical protein A2W55_00475 [Candidatus Nealsonbacteri